MNQEWYEKQGDRRSPEQRSDDLRRQAEDEHIPDSVRDKLLSEAEQNERESGRVDE